MKRIAAVVLIAMLLFPAVASAGASTDAALGLGAFAVFNQIISGTGIFGAFARPAPAVAQPVVVAPPPVVVYQTPVPVYYHTYVEYVPVQPAWCPPGLAKKGRCHGHGRHHH